MRMSESEFKRFCQNRQVKVQVQGSSILESLVGQGEKKKSPKYKNRKVYVYKSGVALYEKNDKFGELSCVYDSEKEFMRHSELKILERQKMIQDLRWQVPILIQRACERNGEKIAEISYVADFMYFRNGQQVIEDVKGFDEKTKKHITTKDFRLKWKLLKYLYPQYTFEIY